MPHYTPQQSISLLRKKLSYHLPHILSNNISFFSARNFLLIYPISSRIIYLSSPQETFFSFTPYTPQQPFFLLRKKLSSHLPIILSNNLSFFSAIRSLIICPILLPNNPSHFSARSFLLICPIYSPITFLSSPQEDLFSFALYTLLKDKNILFTLYTLYTVNKIMGAPFLKLIYKKDGPQKIFPKILRLKKWKPILFQ